MSIKTKLRDTVTFSPGVSPVDDTDAVTVPALVTFSDSITLVSGNQLMTRLTGRVIVTELPTGWKFKEADSIHWHGERYYAGGKPIPRYIGARLSHYTITIDHTAASPA